MSETLKLCYAVATPHEDIREERLAEDLAAAQTLVNLCREYVERSIRGQATQSAGEG